MLLEQPNDEDELCQVSGRGPEGLRKVKEAMTYQIVVVGMPPIRRLLRLLLLSAPPPPKDPAVALVIRVYRLHQRVDRCEEAGQQRTATSRPESGDKLLVASDCEHSRQKLLWHLRVKQVSRVEGVRRGQQDLRPCSGRAGCTSSARTQSSRRNCIARMAPSGSTAGT